MNAQQLKKVQLKKRFILTNQVTNHFWKSKFQEILKHKKDYISKIDELKKSSMYSQYYNLDSLSNYDLTLVNLKKSVTPDNKTKVNNAFWGSSYQDNSMIIEERSCFTFKDENIKPDIVH